MKEDFYLNQINTSLFSNFRYGTRVNDVKLKNNCRIIKKLVRQQSAHARARTAYLLSSQ